MNSLTARVSLIAAVVVAAFVVLTAIALDRAFRHSAEAATRERLTAELYLLLADAELDADGGLHLPDRLRDPRLALPGSGLYATIDDGAGTPSWRSPSAAGSELPPVIDGDGETLLRVGVSPDEFFVATLAVQWEYAGGERPLRFLVYEDLRPFEARLDEYRAELWRNLGVMALLLLIAQAAALAWGLRPLRTAAQELKAIESGERERLLGHYPRELHGLTDNLNALLGRERARQQRYRHALDDLAHSLKTPLAVLRALDVRGERAAEAVAEQVSRMDAIVQRQLAQATVEGRPILTTPVAVAGVAERLLASLHKVYRERGVETECRIAPGTSFHGDEGDLMELLGNLLDNAFKWCRKRVRVEARAEGGTLWLTVADDGPGIAPAAAELILRRGVRLDESTPGQGIGLAMVNDLAKAYGGAVEIDRSPWQGAEVRIRLPGNRVSSTLTPPAAPTTP